MVRLKFTQKFLQTRPAAGLAKHPFETIRLFLLNVLVYIRLVKLVLQHATYHRNYLYHLRISIFQIV